MNWLLNIMANHNIQVLVDVRTTPYSRYSADFNRPNLKRVLGEMYVWKGYCLGGKSGVKQPEYNECLRWLAEESKTKNVCIMCMESNPTKCHRDFWIARDLKRRFDVDAEHLGRKKTPQKDLAFFVGH